MTEHVYQLTGVTKEYSGRTVIRIDDLRVERGRVLAIVGPSGSGKSTLLRMLNFLERPTGGSIRFMGIDQDLSRPIPVAQRRRVTMVFQRPVLLNRSVHDNVAYGLLLRGERDSEQLVRSTLEMVGLGHLARQRATTLSGGESQRVALARAIVLQPDVLLLDEPSANLDPYNVALIEDVVRGLNASTGTTIVMVTHNVFQARRLSDHAALLLSGQLIEKAEAGVFFQAPTDLRTAAFVRGDMVY